MYIIGGKFKRRPLTTPKTDRVRPTTSQLREAVFNICQHQIEESRFLDLFAGSGAMGLEALSRGASFSTFVENNRVALAAIKKNIATLKVESESKIIPLDVFNALRRLEKEGAQFEIIYVDPPYGENLSGPVLDFLDTHSILTPDGSLFIEDASLEEPPLTNLKLHGLRRVGRANLYEYRFDSRVV